jgi:hypothetical protein
MNLKILKESIEAAEAFLKAAKQVPIKKWPNGESWAEAGKHSATAKRKSMDLTRALSELRKSN